MLSLIWRRQRGAAPSGASPSDTLVQLARATLTLSAAQRAGGRHTQADAYGFYRHLHPGSRDPVGVTAVIAEGTGDLEQGAETSSTAAHVFLQALAMDIESGSPVLAALERAMRAANAAVVHLARNKGVVNRVGSTLAAVMITADGLHWIASGESRIYLWRRGALHEVNLNRRGALDFSRRALRLDHGDRLVLCGAGVYEALSQREIAEHVGVDGTAPAEELVGGAVRRQRPTAGNVTALVVTHDERDASSARALPFKPTARTTLLENV
jgi:serine/threonine protein phosphatase PrpC